MACNKTAITDIGFRTILGQSPPKCSPGWIPFHQLHIQ